MDRGDSTTFRFKGQTFGIKGHLFDAGLALSVIAVVVMMIVPLTPWLLDLLISLNLGISILVLSLALFIRRPLAFTAFPTLLLVATLYRLALNVSSTRLILIKADAGRVIGGFGGFVVGGDILVGAVIFGILAMVLFLVITKGAERVAEVAARFTLDALPGLQLAIDSDLRSGSISSLEASRSRSELDRQSRYYGSLDGAMKFVRGDAVAGLVIIAVNIAGGLSIGMLRHGMSIGQALDTYGRLTIGDGLVTMIPALLISTAAGLLVTRVGQGDADGRLGDQLGRQLFAEPRALAAAGVLMLILAVVPGLPAWPFVLLGVGLGIASSFQFIEEHRRALTRGDSQHEFADHLSTEVSAEIELGGNLYNALRGEVRGRGGWHGMARSAADSLRELGLPIGAVPLVKSADANNLEELRLIVRGVVAEQMIMPADLDGILRQVGIWLRSKAWQLVGIDEVQRLVDRVARTRPVLVRETVPKLLGLPALTELLQGLVRDGISLNHLAEVLEVLSRATARDDSDELVQEVRQGLTSVITALVADDRDSLSVLMLDIDLESVLETSLVTTSRGRRLALSADVATQVVQACRESAQDVERPVFLVKPQLRSHLADLLAVKFQSARVVAYGEIESSMTIEVVQRVDV
ncbi:MAG: FHIPEP family type III secretion protein [Proteobacteria bacterium]|nr:FHIPEP family type III secretion protein [Pseudomonadota bacterium]